MFFDLRRGAVEVLWLRLRDDRFLFALSRCSTRPQLVNADFVKTMM